MAPSLAARTVDSASSKQCTLAGAWVAAIITPQVPDRHIDNCSIRLIANRWLHRQCIIEERPSSRRCPGVRSGRGSPHEMCYHRGTTLVIIVFNDQHRITDCKSIEAHTEAYSIILFASFGVIFCSLRTTMTLASEDFLLEFERVKRLPKPSWHYMRFLRYQIERDQGSLAPYGALVDKASDLDALLHPEDHFAATGSSERYISQRELIERATARPSNGETELAYWDFRIRSLDIARYQASTTSNASQYSKYSLHAIQERLAFHGVISRESLTSVQQLQHAACHAEPSSSCRLDGASPSNPPQDTSQLQDPSDLSPPRLPPAETQVHRHVSPRVLGPAHLIPSDALGPQTTAEKPLPGLHADSDVASGGMPAQSAAPPKVNKQTAAPGMPNHSWLCKPATAGPARGVSRPAAPRVRRGGWQVAAAAVRADIRPPMRPSIAPPEAAPGPATARPPPAEEINKTSGEGAANEQATSRQPSPPPKGSAARRTGQPTRGQGGHPPASGSPRQGEAAPRKTVKRGRAKVFDIPDESGSDEEGQGDQLDPMGVRPISELCALTVVQTLDRLRVTLYHLCVTSFGSWNTEQRGTVPFLCSSSSHSR